MTSLVLAYSPLTTASRTAPTISGGSATLIFSTLAIGASAPTVAKILTKGKTLKGGKPVVVVVVGAGDDGRHWIITAYIARKLAEGEIEWVRS
jgi:hypothetical protein